MKKQNGYLKRLYAILLAVFMVTTEYVLYGSSAARGGSSCSRGQRQGKHGRNGAGL